MADAEPENTRQKHGLWQPGQSGNPAGKPKGARNKLGEAFIEALHDDFNEHGIAAIQTVRAEKPDQYLKVIASLLPKDVNLNFNPSDDMTDDELIERIRALDATIQPYLAAQGAGSASVRRGGQNAKASGKGKPAQVH